MRKLALLAITGVVLFAISAYATVSLPVVDDFQITCGTTASPIKSPGLRLDAALYCQFPDAEPVAMGGADVDINAPKFCNDSACIRADFPVDARGFSCIAASSTVITCIAGGS